MSFQYCDLCRNYAYFSDKHGCSEYECQIIQYEYDENGWCSVYSNHGYDDADRKYTEEYDQDDYYLIRHNGESYTVLVRRADTPDIVLKYEVYGESVPTYYAYEKKEEKKG